MMVCRFLRSLSTRSLLAAGLLALALLAGGPLPPAAVLAATPNLSPAISGVQIVAFHISGQYTATTAAVARFTMPFPARVIGVQASARASGGTTPTLTVDVKAAGTTILSAPIAVTAAAVAEGTVTTPIIADETAMTVDFTITGTSPTWNDIVVVLTIVRT